MNTSQEFKFIGSRIIPQELMQTAASAFTPGGYDGKPPVFRLWGRLPFESVLVFALYVEKADDEIKLQAISCMGKNTGIKTGSLSLHSVETMGVILHVQRSAIDREIPPNIVFKPVPCEIEPPKLENEGKLPDHMAPWFQAQDMRGVHWTARQYGSYAEELGYIPDDREMTARYGKNPPMRVVPSSGGGGRILH